MRHASLGEQDNAKRGETEEEKPLTRMGDKGCNIRKIVGQEIANQANDIANEDDPAKPTWKNVCPDRHYAKEERANDRQWPNQEQEVRDMERGYEASDASLKNGEDQHIKPNDNQSHQSIPTNLFRLSTIEKRYAQERQPSAWRNAQ